MGSTSLHYACQYCQVGKPFSIIKLLQVSCDATIIDNVSSFVARVMLTSTWRIVTGIRHLIWHHDLTKEVWYDCVRDDIRLQYSVEAVSLLIDSDIGVIESCTNALVEACRNGRKEIVETFLESGADPNLISDRTG